MTRTKAERIALARDDGYCRRCSKPVLFVPWSLHHRRPRGMGGGDPRFFDCPSNLAVLCGSATTPGSCHLWAESERSSAYAMGWLVRRNSIDEPYQIPLTDLRGSVFFLSEEGGVIPIAQPGEPPF